MSLSADQKARHKKIVFRCALFWAWAIITPTIVMVVLDLFDKHTPNNIIMFSLFLMIIPFQLCHHYLSNQLTRVMTDGAENES